MKGTNIASVSDKFTFYTACFYNRIREDRKNKKGSTPTKLKISIAEFSFLPQLHVATDIPYSYAVILTPDFINRNLLREHIPSDLVGYIAYACISENPEYVLDESDDEDSVYDGKPVKFHPMAGVIGLEKVKKKKFKNYHISKLTELDCSIGYSYEMDIDEDDISFDKDGFLDYNKTLIYATNFTSREISLVDRGDGACKGAGLKQELSKKSTRTLSGVTDKLKKVLMKSTKIVKSLSTNKKFVSEILKNKIIKYTNTVSRFSKLTKTKIFKAKNLKKIIIKNIEDIPIVFKKKDMSTSEKNKKEDKMDTTEDGGEKNLTKKETTTDGVTPAEAKEGTGSEKKQPLEDDVDMDKGLTQYLSEKGLDKGDYDNFFRDVGLDYMKDRYKGEMDYIENSKKTFPGFLKTFENAVGLTKNDENFNLPEQDSKRLNDMRSEPCNGNIFTMVQGVLAEFKNLKQTNTLAKKRNDEGRGAPMKYKQDTPNKTYYEKFKKRGSEESLTLGTIQKKDLSSLREKVRSKPEFKLNGTIFQNMFDKYYRKKEKI